MVIEERLLGNKVSGKTEMVRVEILSHARVTTESLALVCTNSQCASYGETYRRQVRVYHNCRVRYPDGAERDWETFHLIQESCPKCSD